MSLSLEDYMILCAGGASFTILTSIIGGVTIRKEDETTPSATRLFVKLGLIGAGTSAAFLAISDWIEPFRKKAKIYKIN